MRAGLAIWANPSSPHAEGRKAKSALEGAREQVKQALGWPGEVIFTSGASDAARLAFDQAVADDQMLCAAEHDSIRSFAQYRGAGVVPVLPDGAIDLAELERFCTRAADAAANSGKYRCLAAVQHINSETGNQQDIDRVAVIVHQGGGLLLVDCAQSAGKFDLPQAADMVIISAHKFGGPIGIGALLVKDFAMLKPTGGHERGYRRGTENLPAILGMAAALAACAKPYLAPDVLQPIDQLAREVRELGGVWLSDRLAQPTPYIQAVAMPNMSGSAQLMRFDMAGIAVSQGSACSSGTLKTSHVLEAMGIDDDLAARMIRVSFGWNTNRPEVERFCELWLKMAKGIQ